MSFEYHIDLLDISDSIYRAAKARRGAVNTAAYNSESSDEEPDTGGNPAGEDDDMFGNDFSSEKKNVKKGDIKYIRGDQIEGQEWGPGEQDYNEEGVKITPFNMEEEMEEGYVEL